MTKIGYYEILPRNNFYRINQLSRVLQRLRVQIIADIIMLDNYFVLKLTSNFRESNCQPNITLAAMSKILSSLVESAVLEDGGGGGGGGFTTVGSESPRTMFTRQYSINAMNTNTVQTDIKASTAFKYETGGNEA